MKSLRHLQRGPEVPEHWGLSRRQGLGGRQRPLNRTKKITNQKGEMDTWDM